MKELKREFLGVGSHSTYPHMNGYSEHGKGLVYRRTQADSQLLLHRDLESGNETVLLELNPEDSGGGCWEVALDAPRLVWVRNNRAEMLDLENPGSPTEVYRPPAGNRLDELCSLTPDGSRLLTRHNSGDRHVAVETDLETGESRELFHHSWHANHFHYCPHDPEWVGFAHEGWTEDIFDRCWVWHRVYAPRGRTVFDQESREPGKKLCVGHEHWCYHDVSAYVPAYMHSPAGPRGLYEIFGNGRPPRLRWESDTIWHCTMDVTGRHVAVDTAGPFREEPYTEEQYRHYLEIFKRKDAAKEPMDADVAVLDLETGTSLWLAKAQWTRHPYHPHPAISPDARWVAWNDSLPEQKGLWLAELTCND
ncbi:MAG: hypothetical protein WD708_02055 [Kiritimatiellia bacterium]